MAGSASGNVEGGASGGLAQIGIPFSINPSTIPSLPTVNPSTESIPTPTFLNIEADFAQAYNVTDFAIQHAATADAYIAQLGALAAALVPPTINPQFPINPNAPTIEVPPPPDVLPIAYAAPPTPTPFSGQLDVDQTYATFTTPPPQLLFPNAPVAPNVAAPGAPSVNLNFRYPTVAVELPEPPPLLSINVVPFDGVTFPVFDAKAPVLTLAQPQIVNYVPNAPYTDALLSGLMATLESRLAIGVTGTNTGLPAAVEQNIWNRGRERDAKQLADDLAALDRMEAMGYALPPGVYIDSAIKVRTEWAANSYGTSREVMIKQAELEQTNISKAMDVASSIENYLITYANQSEQRRFDACKYATDAGVSIYNAGVQAYSAAVQGFRASVDVYTAQIAGARAIVDVYTAEIAAEKLKVDANTALIQEYKTMVDAAMASIEVFKGEIEIVQTQAQIENLKVSIYGEQIKAYAAQVNVYTSQVEAYKAQTEAEGVKENVYKTQAEVYSTLVDAQYKSVEANIEVFKAQLAAKTEEYDAFKALVESQAENVKAIAAANASTAQVYTAQVSGASAYNEAITKEWESLNSLQVQIAQVGVAAAQANGNLYLTAKSVATDAAKVGAQVEAQLAASALGTVTWATHRSRQDSASLSASQSKSSSTGMSVSGSVSYGTSNNFAMSASTNVSTSASLSSQFSTVQQNNSVS